MQVEICLELFNIEDNFISNVIDPFPVNNK